MSTKKKILSFDVGIKNLAFCLMEINNNDTFKIILWDVINIAPNRKTCCMVKQNGELCESISTYMVSLNSDNSYYYCSQHIDRAQIRIFDINIRISESEPDDIEKCRGDLLSGISCECEGIYNTNILEGSYCKRHINRKLSHEKMLCEKKGCSHLITKAIYTYYHLDKKTVDDESFEGDQMSVLYCGWCAEHFKEEYMALIKKKTKKISQNCNRISLDKLACSMYEQLDSIPELLQADEVFVENQPTFINPTMKTISSMLYGYFILRGIYEKNKTNSNIQKVCFCSPSNKLKVGGNHSNKLLDKTEKPKVYRMTKNLGINYCKKLIEDDLQITDHLMKYKKKDDLCDSFLQAFVMIFNPIPDHYFLKLQPLLESETDVTDLIDDSILDGELDDNKVIGKTKAKKGNTFNFGKKRYYSKKVV